MSLRITSSISKVARPARLAPTFTTCRALSTVNRPTAPTAAPKQYRMASVLQSTAQAAHSAFAGLASAAPVKVGDAIPDVEVKINDLEDKINFSKIPGKNILVLVPGAFSPTCSSQIPGYLEQYNDFKAKGVKDIYVVAVNDMFVVNAWKEKLLEGKTESVKFAADDASQLASALGVVLDAQAVFGGPRFKRGAIVFDEGKVTYVGIEKTPAEVTVSHADSVLKAL
ncbi:hypothetical protein IAT38_000720 [Cryptococcus sp. DSM 104549]